MMMMMVVVVVMVVMCGCEVDRGEILQRSGSEDDRGQLAECLAFISDMALTGDAEAGGHRVDAAAAAAGVPNTGQRHSDAAQDAEQVCA